MYVYFYDNFLRQKKYESILKAIETRLTDYEIAGKIVRLQNFTSVEPIIAEEIKRGVNTVVLVGNDITFGKILSQVASFDITFGFIPIGYQNNSIAEVLGIPIGEKACDILARRRKLKLDIGWFNNHYFISELKIYPADIKILYDDKFVVHSQTKKMELTVSNLKPYYNQKGQLIIHPQDGKLEAFLRPVIKGGFFKKEKLEEASIFPFSEMIVKSDNAFTVESDGNISKHTKITVRLAKNKINMVVGRNRLF